MPNLQNFCKEARYIVFQILEQIPKINIHEVDINAVTHAMFIPCKSTKSPSDLLGKRNPVAHPVCYYFTISTNEHNYDLIKEAELDKDSYYDRIKSCYWLSDYIGNWSLSNSKDLESYKVCLNQYLIPDLSCLIIKYLDLQELTQAEISARKNPKRLKLYDNTEIVTYYTFEFRELMMQEIQKHVQEFDFNDLPSISYMYGPNRRRNNIFSISWFSTLPRKDLIRDYEHIGSIVTSNKDWKIDCQS